MYVIVSTGGKQYRAEKDGRLIVEKIDGEPGTKIELDTVVAVCNDGSVDMGSPYVKGASVKAEIVRQGRGKKIRGFTYKPKKNVRRRWGHRQAFTELKVLEVSGAK